MQEQKDEYAKQLGYGTWPTAMKCMCMCNSEKELNKFIDGFLKHIDLYNGNK